MSTGRRIIAVMNKKGGCGKSTLVRGLASAAIDRGERVTIFDTDSNQGIAEWMNEARRQGYWHDRIDVVGTLSAEKVLEDIQTLYEGEDEDHLILIDTFGGGSEAHDEMAMTAHLIVSPCRLSSQDVRDTTATGIWHEKLKSRVDDPSHVPPFRVVGSHVGKSISESAKTQIAIMFETLPTLEDFVLNRACYERMNDTGLLGVIRDKHPNRSLVQSIAPGLTEMGELLDQFDEFIKENA